jgi:hypothetical protein
MPGCTSRARLATCGPLTVLRVITRQGSPRLMPRHLASSALARAAALE